MTDDNLTPGLEPETKLDSVGSMFVNVFTEPTRVFHRIKRKSTWLLPLIVALICVTIMAYFTTPLQMEAGKERIQTSTELTPEEKDRQLEGMEIGAKFAWIGAIAAPFIGAIMFFVIVGVLMLIGNVVMGGEANFSQVASVYAWTGLISSLGFAIKVPLMLWKNSLDIRTSLAIILPGSDTSSFLYHLLNSATDVFLVWQVVILIMGIAVIYNFTKGKAATVVLIPTVIGLGIGIGAAMLFG